MHRLAWSSLWIFVFCVPWENAVTIPAIGTVARVTGLVAAAVCLVGMARKGSLRINLFAIFTCIYFIFTMLSIMWSHYPDNVFHMIKTDFQLLALVIIIHQFAYNPGHIRALFWAYVLGSFVIAWNTIHEYQIAPEMDILYRRFVASGFNENDGAFIMALAIPMAWHVALTSDRWFYGCILAYVPVGFYGIMLTGSRGGFLAALIALSAPLFHIGRLSSRARAAVVLGLVPLTLIVLLWIGDSVMPSDTLARIATVTEGRARDDEGGLSGRIPIWMAGLELFGRAPLIGTGAGTFPVAMAALHGQEMAAHNAFVETAVQLGVIGLVLLLLLLWRLGKDVLAAPAAERRTWYVLMTVLFIALMTGSWVWYKHTWLLFALATSHAEHFTRSFHTLADTSFPGGTAGQRRRDSAPPAAHWQMGSRRPLWIRSRASSE